MAAIEKRALHAKHHPNDENIPPPQELPTTPSNSSHTGGVDAERKYRNERKRNARKEMALMSLKNQYSSQAKSRTCHACQTCY